jgi:serine/threonine protein kinase
MSECIGQLVAKKYLILEQLGSGAFGTLFLGENIVTGKKVAIKVESLQSQLKMLKNESIVYFRIGNCPGIPSVKWFGKDSTNYYMVIDLLGDSLEKKRCELGSFSLKQTLQIGIQGMSLIKHIHENGYIHRDIKPDNFLLSLDNKTLNLVDFGLCKKYQVGLEQSKKKGFIGSPNFASRSSHFLLEQSKKDDVESFMYMLGYLLTGELPWLTKTDLFTICREKEIFCIANTELHGILEHVRMLTFDERPEYEKYSEIMRKGL